MIAALILCIPWGALIVASACKSFSPHAADSSGIYALDPTRAGAGTPGGGLLDTSLPQPQCSTGITQSRPFPARAGKVMESAGHIETTAARHGQSGSMEVPLAPKGHAASFPALTLPTRITPQPEGSKPSGPLSRWLAVSPAIRRMA